MKLTPGREDTHDNTGYHREVRTTGWVVVRFVPHPTGVRWLLTSNPLPPLLILPPLSLVLTISSALLGFLVISCCSRRGYQQRARAIADKEKRDEERKKLRGEVEGRLDFDAGDRAEPFRGGAQWQKFASASRPSPRKRTASGSVEVELPSRSSAADTPTSTATLTTATSGLSESNLGSMASLGSTASETATQTASAASAASTSEWDSE